MATALAFAPAASAPEPVIDRTLMLNIAELWPDPLSCPDWSITSGLSLGSQTVESGMVPAEARLGKIGRMLNREARNLRRPTDAEQADMFAEVFDPAKAPLQRWQPLRLSFGPRNRSVEGDAAMIVEAAHLRGYLRKLDARKAEAAQAHKREVIQRDKRQLEGYLSRLADSSDDLDRLHAAAERHRQRQEDELAFRKFAELKAGLTAGHREACRAAERLGADFPTAPVFPGDD